MNTLYLVLAFLLGIVLTLLVSHIRKPDGVTERIIEEVSKLPIKP